MVTAGILPFRENSHGRTGNRTRDLIISSQRLRPLDHEVGNFLQNLLGVYDLLLLQLHLLCLHMGGVNLNKDRMWYYMYWAIRGTPFDIL